MCKCNESIFRYCCGPNSKECDASDFLSTLFFSMDITFEELKDIFPCLNEITLNSILSKNKKYKQKKYEIPIHTIKHIQLIKIIDQIICDLPSAQKNAIICILHTFIETISFKKNNTTFINFDITSNVSDILNRINLLKSDLSKKSGLSEDTIQKAMTSEGIKECTIGELLSIANALHIPMTCLFDILRVYQLDDLYGSCE